MSRWFWVINYIQIFDGQLVMKYRKDQFKIDNWQREWVLMPMLVSRLDSSRRVFKAFDLPFHWLTDFWSLIGRSNKHHFKNLVKQFINDLNKVFPEKKSFLGKDLYSMDTLKFKTWVRESEVLSNSLIKIIFFWSFWTGNFIFLGLTSIDSVTWILF